MSVKKISTASILLALGIIIPFASAHAFSIPGNVLLPMHFSIFIGGMLLGPIYGLILGLLTPILSMFITGMPNATFVYIMTSELAIYGLVAGLLFKIKKINVYISLLISMVLGRLMYGFMLLFLTSILGLEQFGKIASVWTAITTGFIGIVLHIAIIPIVVIRLNKVINND